MVKSAMRAAPAVIGSYLAARPAAPIHLVCNTVWMAVALLFVAGRLAGNFSPPWQGRGAWMAMAGLIVLAWITRCWGTLSVRKTPADSTGDGWDLAREFWPGLALLLILSASSLTPGHRVELAVAWGLLLLTEAAWWSGRDHWRSRLASLQRHGLVDCGGAEMAARAAAGSPEADGQRSEPALEPSEATAGEFPSPVGTPSVTRHGPILRWTRQPADGGRIETFGSWSLPVHCLEREQRIHVPFCPPYATLPEVSLDVQGDGISARVAQLLPQGMRIDCKYHATAEPSEEATAEIEFYVVGDDTGLPA